MILWDISHEKYGPRHLQWHWIPDICYETCGIVLWSIIMCGNVWDRLRASPGMIFGAEESPYGLAEHPGAFSRPHRGLRRSGATSDGSGWKWERGTFLIVKSKVILHPDPLPGPPLVAAERRGAPRGSRRSRGGARMLAKAVGRLLRP